MTLRKILPFLILAFITAACSQSSPTENIHFSKDNGGLTLPDGFKASVVADSLGSARHITVDEDGDLYVVLRSAHEGNGMVALRDEDNDGRADQTRYFGEVTGTGIQIHEGYLYVSSDTSVIRYTLNEDELLPSSPPEVIVSGFPKQNQHAAKSFTFDHEGQLYVNVGAPSNACQEQMRTQGSPGVEPCPQLQRQGGIWRFDAHSAGQTQVEDGQRYATGIRNAVALDWNGAVQQLYLVQHGRDQLHSLWPDHYSVEENAAQPAEEFFRVNEGDNFGWPYAYYDWKKEQKMLSPEYGGDGKITTEEGKYKDPILAFPGHWAPNDLLFYSGNHFPGEYKGGAFITFHGSWNRAPEPQEGYKVVFVPFSGEDPAGDGYEDFATGFPGTPDPQPGSARHRPMGLAQGPDGSLYISDSQQGKIWRIMHTGQ